MDKKENSVCVTKIVLRIKGKEHVLSFEEAKRVQKTLNDVLGNKDYIYYYPIYPTYPVVYPNYPVPVYPTWCGDSVSTSSTITTSIT